MKKSLWLSGLSALVFAFIITACEKDELNPDVDQADDKQNSEGFIPESAIPDSALALLEQLAQQQTLENDDNLSADFSNARIGDGTSRGYVSKVSGYPNRLRITGIRIGELCPNNKVRGDREFEGGPLIYSTVKLHPHGNQLWAWVTFQARETKGDYSTVTLGTSGQWVYLRSIDCRNITHLNSNTYSSVSFRGANAGIEFGICRDGSIENHSPSFGSLVRKFNIIGDTGGDDISHDADCGCDTKIYSIELNPITITLVHSTTEPRPAAGTVPLDLYWSAVRGDNFSTATDMGRGDAVVAGYNCVRKEAFIFSSLQPGTVPLLLYWSPARGDNFITATAAGRNDAIAAGYQYVRTEGYVFSSLQPGTVPLLLYWSPARGDNFTTATAAGRRDAIAAGYQFVRTEGYVYPAN